tara:strand:- start:4534 stop:5040 length:507 start_codon:yes stop_codon:yes gene_type:complete
MINNDKPKKNLLSESDSNNFDEQISFGDEEKLEEKSSEKKMITVTFDANRLDQFKNEKNSYSNQKKPSMFRAPFSFDGRIRRLEYGLSYMISYFLLQVFSVMFMEIPIMILICVFVYMWFNLAQGAKRCHDRGNSGFFQLIPFYGLWMLFGDGDRGENQYGINPKGRI